MGATSRNKGKVGEREWARFCTERGYECHRTAQCRGNTGQAADVEGLPGIHIEVKRTESLRLYDALAQSEHDAVIAGDGIPIVAYRKNDHPWTVIMLAEDWIELFRAWEEVTMKTLDADALIARIMRLSQGDLLAQWTAAGIIGVIEEMTAAENVSFVSLKSRESVL